MERRRILERVLKSTAGIQVGTYVDGEGRALFDLTKEKGMEGIAAERKDSIFRPGKRTSDWLKIKARLQQEFVVGGFTEGKGSRLPPAFGCTFVRCLPKRQATLFRARRIGIQRETA
jgi:ATP-dependent DNA ligase